MGSIHEEEKMCIKSYDTASLMSVFHYLKIVIGKVNTVRGEKLQIKIFLSVNYYVIFTDSCSSFLPTNNSHFTWIQEHENQGFFNKSTYI